jgi:ABC-type Fe3+ transport system, permease component
MSSTSQVGRPSSSDKTAPSTPTQGIPPTDVRPDGQRSRFGRRLRALLSPQGLTLLAGAAIVSYLALVPVGAMLYASVRTRFLSTEEAAWTLDNFFRTARSPQFLDLVSTSVTYAAFASILATALGFALAFFATRTDCPGRLLISGAALFPIIMPGILGTMAWVLLLSPDAGVLNNLFREVGIPAFDLYSIKGMVFVEALRLASLAFLMGVATFSGLDTGLEEAARASGARPLTVLRTITLPLVRPAIISVGFLMFVLAISTFEVPQLIGVPGREHVFVTKIYDATKVFPPDYGAIGAIGFYVLVIATLGLIISQRFVRSSRAQTITGKGFRPTRIALGRWRWLAGAGAVGFFVVSAVLPSLMLIWSSLMDGYRSPSIQALGNITLSNYADVFANESLMKAVRNSLISSISAGIIVTALATVLAFLSVKTKVRGRWLLDFLSMVPIAVPSIIIGVGILFWYLVAPLPVSLYGTLPIMVVAYVTISIPYAMQYLVAGMNQIHQDMEDASAISGASWVTTIRRIYLPLLRPAVLASLLWSVMIAFREVSAVILLFTEKNQVLSVTLYNLWSKGTNYPLVAALGVLMTFLLMLIMLVMYRLSGGNRLTISQRTVV